MSVLTKDFRGGGELKYQNFFCKPSEIDHFLSINQFPDFVFVEEFLESYAVDKSLIKLLEENYDLMKKSNQIISKLAGMNIVTIFSISIHLKTLKILIDSLIKIVRREEEETIMLKTIKERQYKARGF